MAPGRGEMDGRSVRATACHMRTSARLLALGLLLLAGPVACATATSLPDDERARLSDELTGHGRFLRVSCFKGPFWSDETKLLLSDLPPGELNLLTDTKGQPVQAGAPSGIVPAGRRVRIEKVEFPTALVVAGRLPYTPRYHPWISLSVEGEEGSRPLVLVVRQEVKSREQFLALVAQYLGEVDPTPRLQQLPEAHRKAVAAKQVLVGMESEAVEAAWGFPERKVVDVKGGVRAESWFWAGGKRSVALSDSKVVQVDGA